MSANLFSLLAASGSQATLRDRLGGWRQAVSRAIAELFAQIGGRPTYPTIQFLGDSNTIGNDGAGGYRSPLYTALREWRDDFEFVGTKIDVPITATASLGNWYHDAVAGTSISAVAAAYPGYVAILGSPPDITIDMIGTNDIVAGQTLAQMLADRALLDAAYASNCPGAQHVVVGIPPFVAGTTVGANLATWNALRTQYNAALALACARPGYFYLSPDALGPGDYFADGVHLNTWGAGTLGQQLALFLDRFLLGQRRGEKLPRAIRERPTWPATYIPNGAADTLGNAADPGFKPGAASFAVALDWYPVAVGPGTQFNIASYGDVGAPADFWGILHLANTFRVFFGNLTQRFDVLQPAVFAACPQRWHRIVFIAYRDGANSRLGLYVNGQLVGLHIGVAAWPAFAQKPIQFGLSTSVVGTPSAYYGSISAFSGTSIPKPGSVAALRAVENDFYLGQSLVAGAATAEIPQSTNLNDEISGNPALGFTAGAPAFIGAWPLGVPRRPWNFSLEPKLDNQGQIQLTGAVPVAVPYTDIRKNDVVRLALITKAGAGGTGLAPVLTVTPHVGFSLVSVANDTSTWAWEVVGSLTNARA